MTRAEIEQQFLAAQLVSGHAVSEQPADTAGPNARIDRAIYEIDAVMNSYDLDTALHVPQFMDEHMVRMRAILRAFHGTAL